MFPKLKHYLCDKEVNIKQTVIEHLEMLAQKFENFYGFAVHLLRPRKNTGC